ncbi:MAG: hypothetical protein RJQ10_05805 [Haliea sp.]|uniref:hypothetical protein n=1 Tax=Haliea sp. TaxID=1932666 RepID=UPI0032ED5CE0
MSYSLLTTQSLADNSAENSLKPGASNYTGVQGTHFAHQFLLDSDEVSGLGGAAVWLDPDLGLDPFGPGFTLGLRFDTPDMNTIMVTQQPLTAMVGVSAVPAPASLWLLLMGVGTMLLAGRGRPSASV